MLEIGLLIITLFFLLYIAVIYHTGYWKRRNVPGPKSKPIVGNIFNWSPERPFNIILKEWTKKYGSVYGIQIGRINCLVTSDVDMIHELFVTKFDYFHERRVSPLQGNLDTEKRAHNFNTRGARWKRLRALSSPAFSVGNLKKILPLLYDTCEKAIEYLEKTYSQNLTIDLDRFFHEFSLDTISRIAFGQKKSLFYNNDMYESLVLCFKSVDYESQHEEICYMLPAPLRPIYRQIFLFFMSIYGNPLKKFEKTCEDIVFKRKQEKQNFEIDELDEDNYKDYLDFYFNSVSNENEFSFKNNHKDFEQKTTKIEKKLTEDEIIGQLFLFILAGYDTTSNTLKNLSYYLLNNPHVEQRLREEIMEICPDKTPTYEQLNQLKYLDAAIKETLRFCPVGAIVSSRTCVKDTMLGNYKIEAGTIVHADVLSLHFNKAIWGENADEFVPDRWLDKDNFSKLQAANLSFGAGPRICIGMKLAYLKIKLGIIYILRNYTFVKTKETKEKLDLKGPQILNTGSLFVKVKAINN